MADAFDDYALSLSPWMYLRLDDTSGTTVVDASGNSQMGTYVNSPTLNQPPISPDQSGRSVLFNGASQYITVPHHVNFDAAEFTIAVFIKSTSLANNQSIIHKGDNTVSSNQGYYLAFNTTGRLTFATFYSAAWRSVTTTNPIIVAGRDYLITITYTNSAVTIYRNGYLFESFNWAIGGKGTSNQTVKLCVTKDTSYVGYLYGLVSRILFFNSVLTDTQIKTLYEKMIVSYRGVPLEVGKPQTQNRFTRWGH